MLFALMRLIICLLLPNFNCVVEPAASLFRETLALLSKKNLMSSFMAEIEWLQGEVA